MRRVVAFLAFEFCARRAPLLVYMWVPDLGLAFRARPVWRSVQRPIGIARPYSIGSIHYSTASSSTMGQCRRRWRGRSGGWGGAS
eukprot:636474-Prymnesium_polylepis.2